MSNDLKPHTIILPSYCPVAICATKSIAEDYARCFGYSEYAIQLTTAKHVADLLGLNKSNKG